MDISAGLQEPSEALLGEGVRVILSTTSSEEFFLGASTLRLWVPRGNVSVSLRFKNVLKVILKICILISNEGKESTLFSENRGYKVVVVADVGDEIKGVASVAMIGQITQSGFGGSEVADY